MISKERSSSCRARMLCRASRSRLGRSLVGATTEPSFIAVCILLPLFPITQRAAEKRYDNSLVIHPADKWPRNGAGRPAIFGLPIDQLITCPMCRIMRERRPVLGLATWNRKAVDRETPPRFDDRFRGVELVN